MYALLFSCILVVHGVRGNFLFPAWRATTTPTSLEDVPAAVINQTSPESKMYFQTFNLRNLNPVYWFYDTTQVDKLDQLYELVKCVIENEASSCKQQLQTSKRYFEKKKVEDEKKKSNQSDSSPTEKNVQSTLMNRVAIEGGLQGHELNSTKSSGVTETVQYTSTQEDHDHSKTS